MQLNSKPSKTRNGLFLKSYILPSSLNFFLNDEGFSIYVRFDSCPISERNFHLFLNFNLLKSPSATTLLPRPFPTPFPLLQYSTSPTSKLLSLLFRILKNSTNSLLFEENLNFLIFHHRKPFHYCFTCLTPLLACLPLRYMNIPRLASWCKKKILRVLFNLFNTKILIDPGFINKVRHKNVGKGT